MDSLNEKIEELEEKRDEILQGYEDEIERLQEIIDSWNNISTAIEDAKNQAMADDILGDGWEDRVTSGDTGDLDDMTNKYEENDRRQSWAEKQIEETQELIDSVNSYIEAWQLGEISIAEAHEEINDIVGDIMPEIEANDSRVQSVGSYTSQWSNARVSIGMDLAAISAAAMNNVDELTAIEQRRAAAEAYSTQWATNALTIGNDLISITTANQTATTAEKGFLDTRITNLTTFSDVYSGLSSRIVDMCQEIVQACREAERALKRLDEAESGGYARGTQKAKPGLHPVAETAPEIIVRNNGSAVIAEDETLFPFQGGETVLNPQETQEVLTGQTLRELDPSQLVFGPAQVEAYKQMIKANIAPGSLDTVIQKAKPDTGKVVGTSKRYGDVNIDIKNISLPDVRDVDGFARAMKEQFPIIMKQTLMKRR